MLCAFYMYSADLGIAGGELRLFLWGGAFESTYEMAYKPSRDYRRSKVPARSFVEPADRSTDRDVHRHGIQRAAIVQDLLGGLEHDLLLEPEAVQRCRRQRSVRRIADVASF